MKIIFLLLVMLGSQSVFSYTCNRPVNNNRLVVFVDTRDSKNEVEAAAIAACQRGETLLRVGKPVSKDSFMQEMRILSLTNKAVTSLVMSGHDGGGSIYGGDGRIDKVEAIDALKEVYKNKPRLLSQLRSVHLWGCYTTAPEEVAVWRSSFPSLKVLGGFIHEGPSAQTRAAHTVLRDLLIKEQELINQTERDNVKRILDGMQDLNQTYAGVFVEACGENLFYYNANGQKNEQGPDGDLRFKGGNHFVNYDEAFECRKLPADFAAKRKEFYEYYHGHKPIPEDKATGPIRLLYRYARNNATCLSKFPEFNADRLLMLTWFENIKKNFARVYEREIKEGMEEYAMNVRDMNNPARDRWDLPGLTKLKEYINAGHGKMFTPDAATLAKKSRLEIRQMISHIDGIIKYYGHIPGEKTPFRKLKKLQDKMETYLYQMNPKCMHALSWHDYESYAPSGWCE